MGLLDKQTSDLSSGEWAAVWLRYHREQRDEDFWAVDAVFLLPQEDPERTWPLILALVGEGRQHRPREIAPHPLHDLTAAPCAPRTPRRGGNPARRRAPRQSAHLHRTSSPAPC